MSKSERYVINGGFEWEDEGAVVRERRAKAKRNGSSLWLVVLMSWHASEKMGSFRHQHTVKLSSLMRDYMIQAVSCLPCALDYSEIRDASTLRDFPLYLHDMSDLSDQHRTTTLRWTPRRALIYNVDSNAST